jgi:putative SOS response-associated peptidase YedK
MCGRIAQYRTPGYYAERLGFVDPLVLVDAADRRPGYNLAPGTHPLALYADETIRAVHWGYCPAWAIERKLPHAINARVETARASDYFRDLWQKARILVPAEGWFEWKSEAPTLEANAIKQPYYIRRADGEPMFLAALASVQQDEDAAVPGAGLVIVTAAADEGLVDIHDRRPLVFTRQAARRWLDPATTADDLERLAQGHRNETAQLTCYRVSRNADRPVNDEPYLVEPLQH